MKIDDLTYLKKEQPIPYLSINLFYNLLTDKTLKSYRSSLIRIFLYQSLINPEYNISLGDELKTRKYSSLISLYNEFLNNYNSLEEKFDINDLHVSMYLFHKLYEEGILSYDHSFKYDDIMQKINSDLNGLFVLNGYGLCRHISPLYVDILRNKGLDANLIYTNTLKIENINTKNQSYNNLKQKEYKKFIIKLLSNYSDYDLDKYLIEFESNNSLEKLIGNHVLVGVTTNDNIEVLDPTNNAITSKIYCKLINDAIYRYNKNYKNNELLIDEKGRINVITKAPMDYEGMFNTSNVSYRKLKRKKLYAVNLFESEKDVFEKFYDENEEIYNEIHYKLLTLK